MSKRSDREGSLAFDQAMDQVRLLASKFQQYRNAAVGAQSLAVLAAVVCKYDKSQAPFFFHQALGLVQTRLQNEQEPGQKERLWHARALVISLGAECDAELAQQMNREAKPTPESLWSNLRAAHSLLEVNPDKALQFAQQVSTHVADLPHPQLLNFVSLLNKIREQAPSRADDLFVQMLASLGKNPASALGAVTGLGNYVFGPLGAQGSDAVAIMPMSHEQYAYVFQAAKAEASPRAVNAYLAAAGRVYLAAPASGPGVLGMSYLSVGQLTRLAREHAPGTIPEYELAVSRLSNSFTDESQRSRLDGRIGAAKLDQRQSMDEELEKTPNPRRRDEIRLNLFAGYWAHKDLSRADAIASAVEDRSLKSKLRLLLAFGKAVLTLESGDAEQAMMLTKDIGSPLYRTLVQLGIACHYQKRKQLDSATASLNLAMQEIVKVDPKQRPHVLASATVLAAPVDIAMAFRVLEDAIAGFNELDAETEMSDMAPEKTVDLIATNRGFVEVVRFGDLRQNVEIRVDGLTFELSRVVQALASAPPEQLTAALFTLSNERRQGPALAAAAAAYLERAQPKLH